MKIERTNKIITADNEDDDFLKLKPKDQQLQVDDMEIDPFKLSKR